jgi:arylsulfatase
MKQDWIGAARIAVALIAGPLAVNQTAFAQADKPKIVHDSEYYILEAQHGEQWAVEDKDLYQKLAELRQKYGAPPNIIHILLDDTPVGELGIPFIQSSAAGRRRTSTASPRRASTSRGCTPSRPARSAARR